ncbi:MAG TPA: cyclic nucleotide-binding domain-containing protein [Geminicoccaceae bacterium]
MRSSRNRSRGQASSSRGAVRTADLAGLGGGRLDLPPFTRLVLLTGGLIGLGLIVIESLVGNTLQTVRIDKLIHFAGYFVLALLFVLSLRPALALPVLLVLLGLGMVIEYLQIRTGRDFELADQLANALGIAAGACLGAAVRSLYRRISRGRGAAAARRRLIRARAGTVILREGQEPAAFFLIRSGEVGLSRSEAGGQVDIGRAGPGDVVGLLDLLRGAPQFATVRAETAVSLYPMTLVELLEAAGGPEQPVARVLGAMASYTRSAMARALAAEAALRDQRQQRPASGADRVAR